MFSSNAFIKYYNPAESKVLFLKSRY